MGHIERKVVDKLRKYGYKLTPQRRAVVRAITSTEDHLTPAEIYDKVHKDHPNVGLVTIYRTLETLDKLELICEVHSDNGCRSYLMRRPTGHHHHLVCSDCGKVVDFTNCDISELERRLSDETGFQIDEHILEIMGRCRGCQDYEKE